jgi:two-component system LytT family response regulator
MKPLRSLIVDDERLARQKLRRLLEAEPAVEVVGECGNGLEAVAAIVRLHPDVVLLDIEMPGLNGFEVLRRVGIENTPHVIFVTAHDEFAIKAFELEALDYLLKPFDASRLHQAIARARRASSEDLPERLIALLGRLDARDSSLTRILVRSEGRMSFVRVDEIDWIQAADNYVRIHAGRESHLVRDTLASLEARLDPRRFMRVHRSAIVNLDRVHELRALFRGDYEVRLKGGASVPLGRNYRERLISALGS